MAIGPRKVFGIKYMREVLWERRPGSRSYLLRKEVTRNDFVPAPGSRRLQTEDHYYSQDRRFMERWYARH
jgi:hypothetical protein